MLEVKTMEKAGTGANVSGVRIGSREKTMPKRQFAMSKGSFILDNAYAD